MMQFAVGAERRVGLHHSRDPISREHFFLSSLANSIDDAIAGRSLRTKHILISGKIEINRSKCRTGTLITIRIQFSWITRMSID